MDPLLKKILDAPGISGCEKEIAALMQHELKKVCDDVSIDTFGNVIARKGTGKKKKSVRSAIHNPVLVKTAWTVSGKNCDKQLTHYPYYSQC